MILDIFFRNIPLSFIRNLYNAFGKRLGLRSIHCYALPLEAGLYVRHRQENAVWIVYDSVHININKEATITAVLPVSYVTNEKKKEYYSQSYC